MEINEHYNQNDIELDLPDLPSGYSWKVSEGKPDKHGGLWLLLDLTKTVPYGSFVRKLRGQFALSATKTIVVSSRRIEYFSYGSMANRVPTPEEVRKAFAEFSVRSYEDEFPANAKNAPKAHNAYLGTYK